MRTRLAFFLPLLPRSPKVVLRTASIGSTPHSNPRLYPTLSSLPSAWSDGSVGTTEKEGKRQGNACTAVHIRPHTSTSQIIRGLIRGAPASIQSPINAHTHTHTPRGGQVFICMIASRSIISNIVRTYIEHSYRKMGHLYLYRPKQTSYSNCRNPIKVSLYFGNEKNADMS